MVALSEGTRIEESRSAGSLALRSQACQASRIRFIGFEGNVQNVEINELCSLRHGFERSLLSCVTWTAVQGLGTFIKKNRQAS